MIMTVRITPNASRDEVTGVDVDGVVRIKVQSPPVEGAANKRLVKFLSKKAGVSKSSIRLLRGETARIKVIEIDGDEQTVRRRIEGDV